MPNISTGASPSGQTSSASATTTISEEMPQGYVSALQGFLSDTVIPSYLSANHTSKDFYAHLLRGLLKTDYLQRSRVACTFTVLPAFANVYEGVHGGAVAAIAERVAIACARTVVAEDKELFLGELSLSYLSAATINEVVAVEASVVRSGRNITVVTAEFKIKKTGKLVYLSHATFYHMPASKL